MRKIEEASPRDLARGKWRGLLGRWLDEKALSGKHTVCPMCGGKDRFRFDDKNGDGMWICSHCGAGDGYHLLQGCTGMDFAEAVKYVRAQQGKIQAREVTPDRSADDLRQALRGTWGSALPVEPGDPVHRYLSARCDIGEIPQGLRHHPALRYRHDDGHTTQHPAMLAQVLNGEGKAVCIHRTYLSDDGCGKADVPAAKKLMSPTERMGNVAIRLGPIDHGWLGVAEGIETALCARQIHRTGAVWSCISAGLLESFTPPPEVEMLVIFADSDHSYTGQASAAKLARRLTSERAQMEVRLVNPAVFGEDFADEWVWRKLAAAR